MNIVIFWKAYKESEKALNVIFSGKMFEFSAMNLHKQHIKIEKLRLRESKKIKI